MQTIDEQQMLQNLAYQAWLERGRPFGSPEVDWERAEQLLQLYRQEIDARTGPEPSLIPSEDSVAGADAAPGANKSTRKQSRPRQPRARSAA